MRNRFFWLGFLVLAVFGGIAYFLFFSKVFRVEKVIITGEHKVSKEDIESFVPPENLFLIDTKKIRKEVLNNFPQIAEIEIRRGFPDALNILVIERVGVAVWREAEKHFLVDSEGVIFEEAPEPVEGLIEIVGEKDLLNQEKITQILGIQKKLKESFEVIATKAFIASEERLNMETSEGWEIYFNSKGDLNWQITELALVLEKQIFSVKRKNLEYVDLRFSRVFYK